jgi:uncharacterized protein
MSDRIISFGDVSPESEVFWNAAKEGKFLVKKCKSCNKVHWYPRAICPFCMSADTEWVPGAGKGKIYSYSHMARANLTIAYVTLEEGPSMMTNIVDCDPNALKIGQAVKLVFKPSDKGYPVPMFTPA